MAAVLNGPIRHSKPSTHRIASCELPGATAPLAPPLLVMAPLRLPDVQTAHYRSRQIVRSLIARIAELMPPKWKREHRKKSQRNNAEHVTSSLEQQKKA